MRLTVPTLFPVYYLQLALFTDTFWLVNVQLLFFILQCDAAWSANIWSTSVWNTDIVDAECYSWTQRLAMEKS